MTALKFFLNFINNFDYLFYHFLYDKSKIVIIKINKKIIKVFIENFNGINFY